MPTQITKGQKTVARITPIVQTKRAEDSKLVFQMPLDVEDEFQSIYDNTGKSTNAVLAPPFNPAQLITICTCNNILQQCVHVMEVNIDGTGHTIEPVVEGSDEEADSGEADGEDDEEGGGKSQTGNSTQEDDESEHGLEFGVTKAQPGDVEEDPEDDPEKVKAEDFFNEPFPGMSFITIRRKLRVDLEQTGYAYLEAIRNPQNELLMLRPVPSQTVRKLRLDDAVLAKKKLRRAGKEISVDVPVRERRYVQQVGNKTVYFKEFGVERDMDRTTGSWADKGKKVPVDKKAGELLEFGIDRDAKTSYFLPRWINNLPSVLGSRKSEEFNLEFFDSGAVPPLLILIEGGQLTTGVREQLQQQLAGSKKNNTRVAIVEISSASGSLDKPGQVGVKVERFGDARQSDAMFMSYDEKCGEHVRVAFRIPSIFLGQEGSFNFATALVAYMIAEEQVFGPERKEFDEIINNTIMKALGCTNYKFVSKPITLKNVEVMMQALEMGKDFVSGPEFIKQINLVSGLNLEYDEGAAQKAADANDPFKKAEANAMARGFGQPGAPGFGGNPQPGQRPESGLPNSRFGMQKQQELTKLAHDWLESTGLTPRAANGKVRYLTVRKVERLSKEDRKVFNRIVSAQVFPSQRDPAGLAELIGCCE